MELTWASEFEIGNEYVDLQHRYFLELITRIGKTLSETDNDSYKKDLIMELHKYAEFHFISEENIAFSCNLQGIKGHHQLHLTLLKDLTVYAGDLDKGVKTIDEFIEFITDWFLVHTIHEDRKFFKSM